MILSGDCRTTLKTIPDGSVHCCVTSPAPRPRVAVVNALRHTCVTRQATCAMIPTMKTCTKCQIEKPLEQFGKDSQKKNGLRFWCRACSSEYGKTMRLQRPEHFRMIEQQTRQKNAGKIAERKRRYQQSERGRALMLAASKRYRLTERGAAIKRNNIAKYGKTEKGRINGRIRCSRRRARLMMAKGNFNSQDWIQILSKQSNRCKYCNQKFSKKHPATIDHVTPLASGGKHDKSNIAAACRRCNSSKWINPIVTVGKQLVHVALL